MKNKLFLIFTFIVALGCSKPAEKDSDLFTDNQEEAGVLNQLTLTDLVAVNNTNQAGYLVSGECGVNGGTVSIIIGANLFSENAGCNSNEYSKLIDLSAVADSNDLMISVDEHGETISKTTIKDTVGATISSVTISADTYELGEELLITLELSEVSNIEGSPVIELQLDSASSGQILANYKSGAGTDTLIFSYVIQSGDGDNSGINLVSQITTDASNRIIDANGNSSSTALPTTTFASVLISSNSPVITSIIEPVAGTYAEASELLFQVNFSQSVVVSGAPSIEINIGGSLVQAIYKNGSGTNGLEFSFEITAGLEDLNGIEINNPFISLNGGSIKASSDNKNSALGFSNYLDSMAQVIVNTNTGITAPEKVSVVTTAPTTNNTSLSVAWGTPANNGTEIINYSVQYRAKNTSTWNSIISPSAANQVTIAGLIAGTTYEVRVAANNGLLGPYSDTQEAEIFDVLSLNPIAWLSATNITNGGTEPANGEKVSSWKDLTGVAGDATEVEVAKQPTLEKNVFNGLPAVRFDGHAKGLSGTFERVNNGGFTVFLVGKMDTNNVRECFFEFYSITGGKRGFFFNYGMNEASSNFNLDDTTFNLWHAYDRGTKTDMYENSQTIYTDRNNWGSGVSTAFTGAGGYVLGDDQTGGDEFNGYIGEFLVFDRELTSDELNLMKSYLKNKWGTP